MKRTTTGRWSHITCALVIGEVGFEDIPMRRPIRIENITAARRKLVSCAELLTFTVLCSVVSIHLYSASLSMSHSEALLTTALILCPYVATRVRFEPATFRRQGTELTTQPPCPTSTLWEINVTHSWFVVHDASLWDMVAHWLRRLLSTGGSCVRLPL